MKRMNVVELKNTLGDVLNRAEYQGERIIIHRRGKDAAALISMEDLRLFERLLEQAEDRADVATAQAALAESDERLPLEEFCRREGLDDEPKPTRRPRAKAGAKAV
jgi:prevent-host-death family protein